MRTVLALAALLACLAGAPANGQPTPPAPGATPPAAHCVGCDALRVTLDAYRIVHRQLEDAVRQRTQRMDELAASALDATPLTAAERAEVKQLDEALRNLVRARDAWKDLIDDLQKAIDDCAKQCAAPAAEGAGRVGQGGTASITMPKAACPQCQGFAQGLFMLQVAKSDVEKRLQERRAELSAASAQAAGGQQSREQYQRVQAMRKEVDLLAGAARSLQWDIERMEAALRNCNRRCPGGEGYSDWEHLALAGLSLFDQPEEDDRYTAVPPERRGKALCPECIPAQQALEAARAAVDKARERRERLQDEMRPLNDQLNDLRWRRYAAESELEQIRSGLSKEPNPQARAAELRSQLDNLDAPIRDLNRKIRPLREAIREIEQELPGLRRAVEEAELALIRCNRERCKTAVRVDTVVGVTGTNPFNPDNPTGTAGGTQPPPQPQGPGTLQFSASSYSGGEGGAVLVIVTRGGGSQGAVSVQFATGSGSATPGSDFQPANGTLNWADGDASPKSFSIPLLRDNQAEGPETFPVNLANPTGGATLGAPASATVTIADADSPAQTGSVQFSASSYATAEGQGTVTITVTRTGGADGPAAVQFFTGPSSATAGADYTATNGTLTWAAGDATPKSFTIAILDDTAVEGPESFFVTLNSPTGASLGAPATVTVTINDNDVATGPCGQQGNAWQPNTGAAYACSGSCDPTPSPQTLTVNGDRVTLTPFHAGGAATFLGCTASLNSERNDLVYFGQANHRATITRSSGNAFNANITSSGGGTCFFSCTRSGP